jgi:alanine dehydrogenase
LNEIWLTFLNGADIDELALDDADVLAAVEEGLRAAVELSLTDIMDKIVVDDWGQCRSGPFGALRQHVESGRLSEQRLHGELCEIVAGRKPGRERAEETILFWHRGLSLADIALGAAMLSKAGQRGG